MSDVPSPAVELGPEPLTARGIEPAANGAAVTAGAEEAEPGHTHESSCLNCGTRLVGSHCHACGQHAHVHRTLGAFSHDLLHGVFHVEGKIWRTLPMLVWRPGRLTREYIDGRRASYVSPIALFLFAVFLMFSAMHLAEGHGDAQILNSPQTALAVEQAELARLRQERAAARGADEIATIDRHIAGAEHTVARIAAIAVTSPDGGKFANNDAELKRSAPFVAHALETYRANPDLAIFKIKSTVYKYSWLLIPMSVPFVWLLFPFSRRFHLYDHTVFVTYSLTFMTLLEVVSMLFDASRLPASELLALVVPVHMFRQLRATYALGVGGALWRTVLLFAFAVITFSVFLVLLLSVELGH